MHSPGLLPENPVEPVIRSPFPDCDPSAAGRSRSDKGKGAGGAFAAGGGATERTFLWSASGGPLSTEGKGRKLAPHPQGVCRICKASAPPTAAQKPTAAQGLRPPGSPRRGGRTSYGSCQCGQPLPPRHVCAESACRPRIMQLREFGSLSVGCGANKGRNGCLRMRQWLSGKGTSGAAGAISFAGGWYAPPCHSEARYGPKNPYLNGRDGFFASLRMTGVV